MTMQYLIDWDKNNDFTGDYDDVTADVISAQWFLGARNPYQSVCDEPTLELTLRNTTGKYSPENTGSVLAGKVRPYCRVRVVEPITNTELWNGYLDFPKIDWRTAGEFTGKDKIIFSAIGAKTLLERITVTVDEYSATTGNVIIEDVLEDANVFLLAVDTWFIGNAGFSEIGETTYVSSPGVWRELDEGQTTFDSYGGGRERAWDVIRDVTETERAKFYIDRLGRYIWRNRHYNYLDDSAGVAIADTSRITGIQYAYGDLLVNSVTVTGRPRRTDISETLWALEAPISISPGQVVTLQARLRRSTGQFATATSLTPTSTFSLGSATITVTPNGGVATVEIENTTSTTAILSTLTLAGTPKYDQNQLIVNVENTVSISQNGKLEKQFSLNNISEYSVITDIGHMELLRSPLRGRVISFSYLREDNGVDNAVMVTGLGIGDFVEIDFDDTLYHTGRYIIIGEAHNWDAPNIHGTTFFVEPVEQLGFVLDVEGRMELDGDKTILIY